MTSKSAIFFAMACLYTLKGEITFMIHRRNLPPSDLGLPFFGHFIAFLRNPEEQSRNHIKKYGQSYAYHGMHGSGVMFTQEDDIKWVWNLERKGQAVSYWPPVVATLIGKGALISVSGKRHKLLRRILEPAFTPNALRDYFQTLDGVVLENLSGWSCSKDKPVFYSSVVFKMFSLQLLLSAAFGQIEDRIKKQLHDDFVVWFQGLPALKPWYIPGTAFAKAVDAKGRILANLEYLIKKFKAENPEDSKLGQKSLMGRLCYGKDENGDPLSIEALKDNLVLMLFAGHDTTYASLGSTLHYLSLYPEMHAELEKEAISFRDPLDFDELKNAPVMTAFLTEMWRMDPPVARAQRMLLNDVEFSGFNAKKGMLLTYSCHGALKNEETYASPYTFDIQRFLPNDHPLLLDPKIRSDSNKVSATYPVFGGGSRMCVGNHFAKLELRLFLTRLLQKYELVVRNSEKVHFPVGGWKNEFYIYPKQE